MASIRKKQLKSGATSHEVRIHRAGYPDLSKSFPTLAEARRWANEMETKIDKGERVSRKAERFTLADVFADFLAAYKPKKGGEISNNEKLRVQALNHDLGEFAVANLTRDHVEKYVDKLLLTKIPPPANRKKIHPLYNGAEQKTYAPSSVRKLYYQLKKCMEWHAMREKYNLENDLFKGHQIPEAWGGERDRRLEEGEEEKLYAAADRGYDWQAEWKLIIGFALETAMRAQEILLARWRDLNLEGRTLNIPKEHVKTKTFRQIPLSRRAVEIVKEMEKKKKEDSERIFWMWNGSTVFSAGFHRLAHRAKLDDLKFHDLRHEATSRFFEKGKLSDMEIMKITGHTEYSTLERYVKLRPLALAEKMD